MQLSDGVPDEGAERDVRGSGRARFSERGAGADGDPDEGTIPVQLSDGDN